MPGYMQLIVTVKRLNKRKAIPAGFPDHNNIVGEVRLGFSFEGEEVAVAHLPNPALGKWYRDRDGYFYWGGGVSTAEIAVSPWLLTSAPEVPVAVPDIFPDSEPNAKWLNLLSIAEVWKKSNGNAVNVAVLDTGMDLQNSGMSANLFQYSGQAPLNDKRVCRNFMNGTTDVSDSHGHGSHCASLISCTNASAVIAIAPEARLFVGKINNQGEFDGFKPLAEAILWAANTPEVDIISISFGSSDDADKNFKNLRAAMEIAFGKNKIIVAAIGNNQNDPQPLFPALFSEFCISVGATDSQGFYWTGNAESDTTTIYAPGVDIISNGVGSLTSKQGSSQAAAIVSGVIALLLSLLKSQHKQYTPRSISDILLTHSRSVVDRPEKRLIDPQKIFLNI